MKRVLVAGGAGFIGSHLCKRLLENNSRVYCLDNLSSGTVDNVAQLIDNKNFTFIEHDITLPVCLNIDEIYNLACPASPVFYQKDPINTAKSSVIGTLNLLELAKKKQARFTQASTSEIYGDPLVHPQTEGYYGNVNPIGVRSCYDEGKRMAESFCMDYYRIGLVNVKIARIFNTYGPRMRKDDGRVIPSFISKSLKNEPLLVYGDGNQTRSFMYIDDLINGLLLLMSSSKSFVGPVNLGNPEELTINSLANLIIGLTGSCSKVEYLERLSDDPYKRKPDISSAKNNLSWEPIVGLKVGLQRTIRSFINID